MVDLNNITTDLVFRLGILDAQVKVLNNAVAELQNNCEWFQERINFLENKAVELENNICNGTGRKRNSQRRRCIMKSDAACTKCGDCIAVKRI